MMSELWILVVKYRFVSRMEPTRTKMEESVMLEEMNSISLSVGFKKLRSPLSWYSGERVNKMLSRD